MLTRTLCCLAVLWTACDDATTTADAPPPMDASSTDSTLVDAQVDAMPVGDAAAGDMGVDQGPDAFLGDCVPGAQACLGERGPGFRRCTDDAQWSIEACDDGEFCVGRGECVPDPRECQPGARVCNTPTTPGECVPGEGYRDSEPCADGLVCAGEGRCTSPQCATAEGERSYLGCDYFAHDLQNLAYGFGNTPDAPLGVVISNATDRAAHVTVTDPERQPATLVGEVTIQPSLVAAGAMPETIASQVTDADGMVVARAFEMADGLAVPPGGTAVLLMATHPQRGDSYVAPHAWRITTDQPVAAYQFGPYCCNFSFTNDASLLLPVPALGNTYTYLGVPTWGQLDEPNDNFPNPMASSVPATLTLIGTAAQTDVTVTLPPGGAVQPDGSGRIAINGNIATATLDAYEVMTLQSAPVDVRNGDRLFGPDLSGAKVEASKPVAAFSGHGCAFYPQDQGACDHLEEQLIPDDTWGTSYVLTPPVLRTELPDLATEATFWKVIAINDGTRITLSQPFHALAASPPGFLGVPDCRDHLEGDDVITLDAGQHCEFGTRAAAQIDATAPIMVMGVISGMDSTARGIGSHAGDPSIFILPPISQFRIEYTFLAPGTYFDDYVMVQVPMDGEITLDGNPIPIDRATLIPGSAYRYAHLSITDGPHRISGTRPFGIVVFAFDDWVSYAFTGGLNLNKR